MDVLVSQSHTPSASVELDGHVRVRRFALLFPSHNFPVSLGLLRFLSRSRDDYDVVHAHNYHGAAAAMAALTGQRPLVFTPHYHGVGHSAFRRLLHHPYKPVGQLAFKRSSAVVAVSRAEASLIARDFPLAADKMVVIGNGVDAKAILAAEPFDVSGRILLSVGRLEDYKGVDRVIAAMPTLPPDFELRVIGDGPARARLEELASRSGSAERVRFLGRVSDEVMRRWLRTATVVASMSAHEAFGIVVAEGLAAGASVVASDIPAHRELAARIGGQRVRLVAPDASPEVAANAILAVSKLKSAPADSSALSWRSVAEQTATLYARLMT